MNPFDNLLNEAGVKEVGLNQADVGTTTPEWTTCQNSIIVLVAILITFALGSSPIFYAFINSAADNEATAQTLIIDGEIF